MGLTVNFNSNVIEEIIPNEKYAYTFKKSFLRATKNKGVTLIVDYVTKTDEASIDFIFAQNFPQLSVEVPMQERDPSNFMDDIKARLKSLGKRNISLDTAKNSDILYIYTSLIETADGTIFDPVINLTAIDESET